MRTVIAIATALSLALLSLASAAGARTPTSVLIPTYPGKRAPLHGGKLDSLNWSGYVVTPKRGRISSVSSTFVVPSAGLIPPGFAATWTGIGGLNSSDLIQAGVGEQSVPGSPVLGPKYFAWYELLPASETQLTGCTRDPNCTVRPGDRVSVRIRRVGSARWSIAMTDSGHWSFSKTVTYRSSRSSAEWVLEAPTVGAQTVMAPVGTVHFGPTSTYTAGGVKRTIAQGNPTEVVLTAGGVNEATPSALAANGQSFNDCAYAQSCRAPT